MLTLISPSRALLDDEDAAVVSVDELEPEPEPPPLDADFEEEEEPEGDDEVSLLLLLPPQAASARPANAINAIIAMIFFMPSG